MEPSSQANFITYLYECQAKVHESWLVVSIYYIFRSLDLQNQGFLFATAPLLRFAHLSFVFVHQGESIYFLSRLENWNKGNSTLHLGQFRTYDTKFLRPIIRYCCTQSPNKYGCTHTVFVRLQNIHIAFLLDKLVNLSVFIFWSSLLCVLFKHSTSLPVLHILGPVFYR